MMSHFLANRDALIGQRVAIRWGTMEYVSDSEKLARWQSRPLNGGGFQSQSRGRKSDGWLASKRRFRDVVAPLKVTYGLGSHAPEYRRGRL